MLLRHSPTVDDLLGDSLIQAVMRADNVEPQALRTLLSDMGDRVAAARRDARSQPSVLFGKPALDRRPQSRLALAPPRVRPQPLAGSCGSVVCC